MAVFSSDYVYVSPIIKHANYNTKSLSKYQILYTYGHNKESFNEEVSVDKTLVPLGFCIADSKYHLSYKTEEYIKHYIGIATARVFPGKYIFLNEAFTKMFSRTNSNIYKNIFPEEITNIDYINNFISNTPTTIYDVTQNNHGFTIHDVIYLDANGLYQKAIAEDSEKAFAIGIVTNVFDNNTFTLMKSGRFNYKHLEYDDTSILYLSDKIPGKLVHYTEISNMVYVPIAIYTDNSIIINIQQGSIGSELAPYTNDIEFDFYSQSELNDVVNQIVSEV